MFGLHWSAFLTIFILTPLGVLLALIYSLTYREPSDKKWKMF